MKGCEFENKSFSVEVGKRDPSKCSHGWLRQTKHGTFCTFCGKKLLLLETKNA